MGEFFFTLKSPCSFLASFPLVQHSIDVGSLEKKCFDFFYYGSLLLLTLCRRYHFQGVSERKIMESARRWKCSS